MLRSTSVRTTEFFPFFFPITVSISQCPNVFLVSTSAGLLSICVLSISEGKFHQVKRMFMAEQNEVAYLKRISIGPLKLDETLAAGEYRDLTDEEVDGLLRGRL